MDSLFHGAHYGHFKETDSLVSFISSRVPNTSFWYGVTQKLSWSNTVLRYGMNAIIEVEPWLQSFKHVDGCHSTLNPIRLDAKNMNMKISDLLMLLWKWGITPCQAGTNFNWSDFQGYLKY